MRELGGGVPTLYNHVVTSFFPLLTRHWHAVLCFVWWCFALAGGTSLVLCTATLCERLPCFPHEAGGGVFGGRENDKLRG